MSLFDIFRKKEALSKISTEQEQSKIVHNYQSMFTIHEDLKGLVWIADGEYKNYVSKDSTYRSFETNGIRFTISFMGQDEPSLIYTTQEIAVPENVQDIESPPYFPTYSRLTPEQKWIYLQLLANPYNTNIDIGFVFILYYGLERHLLEGDFERAFRVILKLRDVHQNKSFQSYSANALVLTSMLHQRSELALEFIESLDKDHEFAFSDDLFLICYFSFNIPLKASDIIRMAKTFEFTNTNYIKNQTEIFTEVLLSVMKSEIGGEEFDVKSFINRMEIKKVKMEEVSIFANTSIINQKFSIPKLSEIFQLKKAVNNLLELAHEKTKQKLADMRKLGQEIKNQPTSKKEKVIIQFDNNKERQLLQDLADCINEPVDRHFKYIELQDFYYRYRDIDKIYLEKCIEYCWADINSLNELQEAFINQKIVQAHEYERVKQFSQTYQPEDIDHKISKIKAEGFCGNIPAFNRLVIIFKKVKDYNSAIKVCDLAITYEGNEFWDETKNELIKKSKK
jgi:hypothetical protein